MIPDILLIIGSSLVLGLATVAMVVYLLAVKNGYRDYRHIFLAFPFVIGISVTGTLGVLDIWQGPALTWTRNAFNLLGVIAMFDLAKRFWNPKAAAKREMAARKHAQQIAPK